MNKFATEEQLALRTEAKNRNTDPATLVGFLKSKDEILLMGLGGNRNAPIEVLTKLAAHKEKGVRWAVARNASTPKELLQVLATDSDYFVASDAKKALTVR